MIPEGEDEYDLPVDQMDETMGDGVDAFANVGQGLQSDHKTEMLQYWQQIIDDIERISDDGTDTDVFKSTVLPLARIKKVMKTDSEVRMISAEAPILFAKGCDIFITELTMRAWIHAEENKRRTLQRSDIATAIQKSDVFDFLIDIVPREEAQPRRPPPSHRVPDHAADFQMSAGQAGQYGAPGQEGKPPQMQPPHQQNAAQGQGVPGSVPQVPLGMPGGVSDFEQVGQTLAGRAMPPGVMPQVPLSGQMPGQVPGQLPGQEMPGFNPGMPGQLSNLGALTNVANLSSLNQLDLSSMGLGGLPMGYENLSIPTSLGGPGSANAYVPNGQTPQYQQQPHQQPHQQQHQQQPQQQPQQQQQSGRQQLPHVSTSPQLPAQPRPQNQSPSQSRLQSQSQPRRDAPSPAQPQSDRHSSDQQPLQKARSNSKESIRGSSTSVQDPEQQQESDQTRTQATGDVPQPRRAPEKQADPQDSSNKTKPAAYKDEDSFSAGTRYDTGDLQFSSYPPDSVDVAAYGQNF